MGLYNSYFFRRDAVPVPRLLSPLGSPSWGIWNTRNDGHFRQRNTRNLGYCSIFEADNALARTFGTRRQPAFQFRQRDAKFFHHMEWEKLIIILFVKPCASELK